MMDNACILTTNGNTCSRNVACHSLSSLACIAHACHGLDSQFIHRSLVQLVAQASHKIGKLICDCEMGQPNPTHSGHCVPPLLYRNNANTRTFLYSHQIPWTFLKFLYLNNDYAQNRQANQQYTQSTEYYHKRVQCHTYNIRNTIITQSIQNQTYIFSSPMCPLP